MSAIDKGNFGLLLELRRYSEKGRAMHAYSKKNMTPYDSWEGMEVPGGDASE